MRHEVDMKVTHAKREREELMLIMEKQISTTNYNLTLNYFISNSKINFTFVTKILED